MSRAWIPNLKWPAVAGAVRDRIADGTLKPGAVASIGRLAPEFRVSRDTAARALAALEADGVLSRVPGVGYVVLEPPGPEPG